MVQTKFIAYYRVSTKRQGESGLGLDAQREIVSRHLDAVGGLLAGEYTEIESGTRKGNNRPELAKAIADCKLHGATLIIAKLDRLARNVAFVSNLMESKVPFLACDMPQANNFTIHIMAAMAEFEAECISKRTREALAKKRERGELTGAQCWKGRKGLLSRENQILGRDIACQRIREKSKEYAGMIQPKIAAIIADHPGISMRRIARELNEANIPTARGGKWADVTVKKLMARVAGYGG